MAFAEFFRIMEQILSTFLMALLAATLSLTATLPAGADDSCDKNCGYGWILAEAQRSGCNDPRLLRNAMHFHS